jgi:hypothetical protein
MKLIIRILWGFVAFVYVCCAIGVIGLMLLGIHSWGDHWWVGLAYLGLVVFFVGFIMMAVVISCFEVFKKGIR